MNFAPLRFWSPSRILLLVLLATHHNGLEAFPAASAAAPPTALPALTPSDPTATFERSDAAVAAPPTATPTVGEAPAAVAPAETSRKDTVENVTAMKSMQSENQSLKDALETGRGAASQPTLSQINSTADYPKEMTKNVEQMQPLPERVNGSIESPTGWRNAASDNVIIPDGVREGMLVDARPYTTGNSWAPTVKFVPYPKEVEPKACREPSMRQFLRYTYRPWNLFESMRYRGWFGCGETPMCRVDLNDTRPLNGAERDPELTNINGTKDSMRKVGMGYCSLTDDSYRCQGEKYEDYLMKHVVGKEARVQDLPRDSILIIFGDSHARQIVTGLLCELGCQEVHSELWMMMITGYFPETNTHVVGVFNAKFNMAPPEEWAIDVKEGLAPLGHLTQALQTYFLLGNAYLVSPSGLQYVPYQASAQALKTVFPKAVVLFFWSWAPHYPATMEVIDYGPPFSTDRNTSMKWCYQSDECIGPTEASGYPEPMNCPADWGNCDGPPGFNVKHQCVPGLPNLIMRQLLAKIERYASGKLELEDLVAIAA